ncbi:alpha/beta hydrolase [Paenibacillus sp. PK3_47]|uniref:alpha/beta fold hydrolase n=1 Tax=Paenibacillus sp. PK3_47 TaxID=2072642 RepID=UPI00201D91AB|nr:alpha/beta hydrolase [Paenibacillus sp. PK3_47]UQZ33523.1 alpha/beta hydrolase [Paenibacillus sp. PK3_47]
MEKVTCEGNSICYSDQGEGEVILLLHGFCGSSAYWEKVIPYLGAGYRVIAPDLRGHGASDAPAGPYSIDQMADDVIFLLDALEVKKCYLFGHSMGGYIALSLAERYSSRLQGFGLIHSTGYPDSEEAREKRLKSVSTIQNDGITDFVDGLVPGLFAPGAEQQLLERAREIGYSTPPRGAAGAALAMRERPDRREIIPAVGLPVLLVAGAEDGIVPAERTFTSESANVTKAVISGAGHMSMYEAPQRLSEIIKDFILSANV